MIERKAEAAWNGTLREGSGTVTVESGLFSGPYTFASRFEAGEGTNPDELLGASLASCFSMFLAATVSKHGFEPTHIETTATVYLAQEENGPRVAKILLRTEAEVPDLDRDLFLEYARTSKENCPISKALAATEIEMIAELVG